MSTVHGVREDDVVPDRFSSSTPTSAIPSPPRLSAVHVDRHPADRHLARLTRHRAVRPQMAIASRHPATPDPPRSSSSGRESRRAARIFDFTAAVAAPRFVPQPRRLPKMKNQPPCWFAHPCIKLVRGEGARSRHVTPPFSAATANPCFDVQRPRPGGPNAV